MLGVQAVKGRFRPVNSYVSSNSNWNVSREVSSVTASLLDEFFVEDFLLPALGIGVSVI